MENVLAEEEDAKQEGSETGMILPILAETP